MELREMEEKLQEANRKLASVRAENEYLSKALAVKEKFIENLENVKARKEAECAALMERLGLAEKDNGLLLYELCSVEKKLQMKTEEMEFFHRQDAENGRRMKRLEADCRILRVLARKNGIEVERRRRMEKKQATEGVGSFTREPHLAYLVDVVHQLENENMVLKEFLAKKVDSFSDGGMIPYDQQSICFSEKHEVADGMRTHHDLGVRGDSEMKLMDDFVEMERLALVGYDQLSSSASELVAVNGDGKEMHSDREGANGRTGQEWLELVRRLILEQRRVSKRSIDELLGDVRTALSKASTRNTSPVSSPTTRPVQTDLNTSITKIMELVRRLDSEGNDHEESSGFVIHVLGWESKESTPVFSAFFSSCEDLLKEAISSEMFISGLASLFEWIISNCSSHQQDSNVRDEFERHLGGSRPGTAMELESVQKLMHEMEKMHSVSRVEIRRLKEQLDSTRSTDLAVTFSNPLYEQETMSKQSKSADDEQIESLKMLNEELKTHLTESHARMDDVLQKLSSVQSELDHKQDRCAGLERAYFELQLQHESITKENQRSGRKDGEKELLKTGTEITNASAKLAECEEAILKLEKHLKAIGSARELSIVDKVLSLSETKLNNLTHHPSLRDHLMTLEETSEPGDSQEEITSSNNKEGRRNGHPGTKMGATNAEAGALVIYRSEKKKGKVGFLRKLLLTVKKGKRNASNKSL